MNAPVKASPIAIRHATEEDVPLLMSFIMELAEYERLTHDVIVTEESLAGVLFGPCANAESIICYYNDKPVGYAFFFHSVSTFLGKRGIYLEDVYVQPDYRGKGLGKAMLVYLAKLAIERGCGRFEWSCLNWNKPSIDFYLSLGAVPLEEWTIFRLTGDALENLANMNVAPRISLSRHRVLRRPR